MLSSLHSVGVATWGIPMSLSVGLRVRLPPLSRRLVRRFRVDWCRVPTCGLLRGCPLLWRSLWTCGLLLDRPLLWRSLRTCGLLLDRPLLWRSLSTCGLLRGHLLPWWRLWASRPLGASRRRFTSRSGATGLTSGGWCGRLPRWAGSSYALALPARWRRRHGALGCAGC